MTNSVTLITDSVPSSPTKPLILESLPDIPIPERGCPYRTQQHIDLLLLAIEALELGATESMLELAKQLELQDIIKGRVALWRLRCSNPWRRCHTRKGLTLDEAKALVILASYKSKNLMVLIRQLLLAEQQMREKQLPLQHHFRLSEYLDRFEAHFASRMNPRRTKVAYYFLMDDQLNELAMSLLSQLLFCTGTTGMQRLWISLFDGEVI
jgi:hypothetical protein